MSRQGYLTMVYRHEPIGDFKIMCFTDSGQPAVYADPEFAELHALQLRERHPGYVFHTLDFQVL